MNSKKNINISAQTQVIFKQFIWALFISFLLVIFLNTSLKRVSWRVKDQSIDLYGQTSIYVSGNDIVEGSYYCRLGQEHEFTPIPSHQLNDLPFINDAIRGAIEDFMFVIVFAIAITIIFYLFNNYRINYKS